MPIANINDNDIILIVEDDQVNAKVFRKIMIKRGGYHHDRVLHTEDVALAFTKANFLKNKEY